MRVAIVVLNLDIGGTQRVAVDLADAFKAQNSEVHIITFGNKKVELTPSSDVLIHHFKMQNSLKKTIVAIPFIMLGKMLNIIFRKSFFYINGLLMTILYKYKMSNLEKKYGKFDLVILRGNSVFELLWPLNDKRIVQVIENMNINFEKTIISKLHAKVTLSEKKVVTVSRGVKEKINDLIKQNAIRTFSLDVIYAPLDIEKILNLSQKYIPDINTQYIVSVGRLAEVKNFGLLIDAYNYAYTKLGLKHKLVIVGDGSQKEHLVQKINEYQLNEMIILTGGLSNPYPWIRNADLFVLTSYSEGLGVVILEALASNVKVISTKSVGGVSDIMVDELGEYLVDFSAENLAKKIVDTLLEKKDWNFELYLKKFSPELIVNQYINVCNK